MTKNERIQYLRELKEIMEKNAKTNKIYATVKTVSRSGMSRTICFYYVSKDGYIYNLNYKISKILGYKLTDNGVRVGGCGMDMIFHCLYVVNRYAVSYGIVRQSKNKNKGDLYYNGLVNTNYFSL